MLVQRHWNHVEWQQEDSRRLRFTLGLSILLHVVVLLAWRLPPQVWRVADHPVLTVRLRTSEAGAAVSSQSTGQSQKITVLAHDKGVAAVVGNPTLSVAPAPVVSAPRTFVEPGDPVQPSVRAAPGRAMNLSLTPAGVVVLMVIGDDGRPQQIYWDKLPALTNEQLMRVEAAMREKIYRGGRTIQEVVDVRGLLRLPLERPADIVVPQPVE